MFLVSLTAGSHCLMTLRIIPIRCLMIRGTVCLHFRIRTSLITLKKKLRQCSFTNIVV